jgi:tRNA1Val (adenine37-N6)-methyltransferase
MPPRVVAVDPVLGPLTCDALTKDFEVFQRAKGHRFSVDDVATAYVAFQALGGIPPKDALDLGCGLGSVLLHLAWKWPETRFVGVEAQELSFALVTKNLAHNQLPESRVRAFYGDLRDRAVYAEAVPAGGFALITGTPPYFPPDTAVDALDSQRAYARIEYRGGVEAYIEAAGHLLAEDGIFVLCGDARATPRVAKAAEEFRLCIHEETGIVARAGKPALFAVWTLRRNTLNAARPSARALVIRDAHGERAQGSKDLRAFSGFPELERTEESRKEG